MLIKIIGICELETQIENRSVFIARSAFLITHYEVARGRSAFLMKLWFSLRRSTGRSSGHLKRVYVMYVFKKTKLIIVTY